MLPLTRTASIATPHVSEHHLCDLFIAAVGQGSVSRPVGPHSLHAGLQGGKAVGAVLPQGRHHTVNEVDLQLALHTLILGVHV